MINFINLLKSKSLKVTAQRVAILKIMEKFGHISIQKLHENLKIDYPTISLNTIYLNLNILLENGILSQIAIDNNKKQYEIKKVEHIHLICTKCSSVQDIKLPNEIFEKIKLSDNFTKEKMVINIYGICEKCKN